MTDPQQEPTEQENPDQAPSGENQRPSLLQVVWSIIAALFGVQSARNRERDFRHGKAGDYILVYVILVIALVIAVIAVVSAVLRSAGQ